MTDATPPASVTPAASLPSFQPARRIHLIEHPGSEPKDYEIEGVHCEGGWVTVCWGDEVSVYPAWRVHEIDLGA